MMKRPIAHLLKNGNPARATGVAAIEFAIVLPMLVLIFTGMIEYGRLMWHYDALAKATRDAARYLSTEQLSKLVDGSAAAMARNMVINATAAAGMRDENGPLVAAGDVSVTCAPTACASAISESQVNTVTVSLSYGFAIGGWVPVISPGSGATINDVTLSPHTTMRYMQ